MLRAVLLCLLVSGCSSAETTRTSAGLAKPVRVIRVSADPNNLPFPNDRFEGFENKIASLIATDLGAKLEYTWRAQRRGFFRETLKENECDLVLGVPDRFERALTTSPYYRSTYCMVYRASRNFGLHSLDDSKLHELKIGVQMIGDDGANTPPAHALAARGLVQNIVGFTVYGDYREDTPPARILDALVNDDVDVAFVWGPLAGFYAKRSKVELVVVPLPARDQSSGLPFAFQISMGCRKADMALRDDVDAALSRHRAAIEAILDEYGVPRFLWRRERRRAATTMIKHVVLFAGFIGAVSLAGLSCKREDRGFRVSPPSVQPVYAVRVTDFVPGGQFPTTQPMAPELPSVKNDYENNAYAMTEGQRLFAQYNCPGCHANGGGGIGAPLIDEDWLYGSRPEQVYASIVQGRPNGMPA